MYVLQAIWETIKTAITKWFPLYQSIDLGPIGIVLSTFTLISLGIALYKRYKF